MKNLTVILGSERPDDQLCVMEDITLAALAREEVWIERKDVGKYFQDERLSHIDYYTEVSEDVCSIPIDTVSGFIIYGLKSVQALNACNSNNKVFFKQTQTVVTKESLKSLIGKDLRYGNPENPEASVPCFVFSAANTVAYHFNLYMEIDEKEAREWHSKYFQRLCHSLIFASDFAPLPTPTEVRFCWDLDDVKKIAQYCVDAGIICFDYETKPKAQLTGSDEIRKHATTFFLADPTMMSISYREGSSWVIPMKHYTSPLNINMKSDYVICNIDDDTRELLDTSEISKYSYSELSDLISQENTAAKNWLTPEWVAEQDGEYTEEDCDQRSDAHLDLVDTYSDYLDLFNSALLDNSIESNYFSGFSIVKESFNASFTKRNWVVVKDGKIVTKYNGEIAYWEKDHVYHFIKNWQYCKENNITDLYSEGVVPALSNPFSDYNVTKVGWNIKFDVKIAKKSGLEVNGRLVDPMFMVHTLNELWYRTSTGKSYKGLKDITPIFFPYFLGYGEGVDYFNDDLNTLGIYAATDTDVTLRLMTILESELIAIPELYRVWRSYMVPVIRWLSDVEYNGSAIDVGRIATSIEAVAPWLESLNRDLMKYPEVMSVMNAYYEAKVATELSDTQIKLANSVTRDKESLEKKFTKLSKEMEDKKILISELEELSLLGDAKAASKLKRTRKSMDTLTRKWNALIDQETLVLDGSYFNDAYPYSQTKKYAKRLRDVRAGNHGIEIEDLNFNSFMQLYDVLYFNKNGFKYELPYFRKNKKDPVTGRTTYQAGHWPTSDKKMLREFDDPSGFITKLLTYKALSKLEGTYLQGMLNWLDEDNRLHTTFNMAKTQRLTSWGPNLQNIPSRAFMKEVEEITLAIKKLFYAQDPEKEEFFEVDYSQCEIRITGEKSNDPEIIRAYQNNEDIHSVTAATILGISLEEFKQLPKAEQKKHRTAAKVANFACIYMVSAQGYMDMARFGYGLNLTLEECEKQIELYFDKYKNVRILHAYLIKYAEKYGYVKTGLGSRRHTPNINNNADVSKRNADRRIACNSGTQGLGAQLLLLSAVAFEERKHVMGVEGQVELTVHDSLVGWYKKHDKKEFLSLLLHTCNTPPSKEYFDYQLELVPMKSDIETGPSWGSKAEWHQSYQTKHEFNDDGTRRESFNPENYLDLLHDEIKSFYESQRKAPVPS